MTAFWTRSAAARAPGPPPRAVKVSNATPYRWKARNVAFRAAWDEAAPAGTPRKGRGGPRRTGVTKLGRFIAALGETSNVTAAAEAAGISLSQVYKLRREDPVFARRWFDALAEGYDNLEMELLQHLRGGEEGEGSGAKKKFDVATAFRCLAAHRESVAKGKGRRTLADEVATIEAINRKIDILRFNGEAECQGDRRRAQGYPGSQQGWRERDFTVLK